VRGRRALRPFTAITPVVPGREGHLASCLAALPCGAASPFVVLDPELTAPPDWRSHRPPLEHLLFTSTSNSPAAEHVEELRVCLGPLADDLWGQCVGYPGRSSPQRFRRYLLHNRLPAQLFYRAYDATVDDVRRALDLRRRHRAFAVRVQGADDEALRAAFLRELVR
jgi:hypothetical protein